MYVCIVYLYCIFVLCIFIAYLYCVFVVSISILYLYCIFVFRIMQSWAEGKACTSIYAQLAWTQDSFSLKYPAPEIREKLASRQPRNNDHFCEAADITFPDVHVHVACTWHMYMYYKYMWLVHDCDRSTVVCKLCMYT